MTISLSPKAQQALEERMKRGGYATAEEAVLAGLASLEQQEAFGTFAPGELDALLAEGEADIQSGDLLDADEVFAELRKLGARRTGQGQ
jgi:Arc/MetJ-type ribon-helix-helix transcriptional regulator